MSATPESPADDRPARGDAAADDDRDGDRRIGRRPFMKGATVGVATLAAGGAGTYYGTQEAEAIAPAVIAGGVAASAIVGWTLREYDVLGSDAPPEGLSPEALISQSYSTARTRKSTNGSSIVDSENLIAAIEDPAYTDAKIAAIEALNNQEAQSDVEDAALTELDSYETTVKNNFLSTWNETLYEIYQLVNLIEDHADATQADFFALNSEQESHEDFDGIDGFEFDQYEASERTMTLPDGTDFVVKGIEGVKFDATAVARMSGDPAEGIEKTTGANGEDPGIWAVPVNPGTDYSEFMYLDADKWNSAYTSIEDTFTNVRDGIITWVDAVYSDVQSGELETSDLLTPREQANMMAESEDQYNQAIADLIALNIPVDADNEATITIPSKGATLRGTFAITDDSITLEAGSTYDPSTDVSGSVYFTYDVATGEGDWTEFETGVDGGTATFTSEPYADTEYVINTAAGESATVVKDDFTDQGDGTYTVDLSAQLETAITEVDSVDFYSDTDGSQYETIRLTESFTIDSFEDTDGNSVDAANFERASEPQDDTNYITQEEWDEQQKRTEELIDKYEDSKGGGGISIPGFGTIPPLGVGALILGVIALFAGNN